MKKLICIILLFTTYSALSQSLSVFDINTDDFPIVKAKFWAFDENGEQITDLTPDDFQITENGIEREVLTVTCQPIKPAIAISSVLTIDVSGSMGGQNIEIVKKAAESFILGLQPSESECAITAFYDQNFYIKDFTTNRDYLLQSLNSIITHGGTDYNSAFIEPVAGALLVAKKAKYESYIIVLSDGLPSFNPDEERIIQESINLDVKVFSIGINGNNHISLKNISIQTGGDYFDNISNERQLKDSFYQILHNINGNNPCEIEWISDGCENQRGIAFSISKLNNKTTLEYYFQNNILPQINFSPSNTVQFDAINIGEKSKKSVRIAAGSNSIIISNIETNNNQFNVVDYGGSPPPFTLKPDEYRYITIEYQPIRKYYEVCKIQLESNACIGNIIYCSGGALGGNINLSLDLIHPNGGEIFLAGGDTNIAWEGVTSLDTLRIDFSSDNGKTWDLLYDKASNLSKVWKKLPLIDSKKCLIRLSQDFEFDKYEDPLIRTLFGHSDFIECIKWHPFKNILASGAYDNSVIIWDLSGSSVKQKKLAHDAQVVALDWSPDGTRFVSISNDEAKIWDSESYDLILTLKGHGHWINSVDWSPDGTIIATASNTGTIKLWKSSNGEVITEFPAHLAPISSLCWNNDGTLIASVGDDHTMNIWAVSSLKNIVSKHINSIPNSIEWNHKGDQIAIGNNMKDVIIFDLSKERFICYLDGHYDHVIDACWNPADTRVASGSYDHTVKVWEVDICKELKSLSGHNNIVSGIDWNYDGTMLASCSYDKTIKIWNTAKKTLQSDQSDSTFSIVIPKAKALDINMGKVLVSSAKDSVISAFVLNPGSFKVRIDGIDFSGTDATQFAIVGTIFPFELEPGTSRSIEFHFEPDSEGIKNAVINLHTQAEDFSYTITGEGVLPRLEILTDMINFGLIEIPNDTSITRGLLKNIHFEDISVNSTEMLGPDKEQFEIISGGGSFTLSPNEERELEIRFKPKYIGRTSGRIGFYYEGTGSPAEAHLFGAGIGGNLYMKDDSAYAGEHIKLRTMFDIGDIKKFSEIIKKYNLKLRFEKTILFPIDRNIIYKTSADSTFISVTGEINPNSEYISEVEMITALGKVEETTIDIESVKWFDNNGHEVQFDSEYYSGTFTLLGICEDGGDRLINPNSNAGIISIKPNPVESEIEIEFNLSESGFTKIALYNILGEEVRPLFADHVSEYGTKTINQSTDDLNAGYYLLVFRSKTITETYTVMIVR